jgi:mannosyltransferase
MLDDAAADRWGRQASGGGAAQLRALMQTLIQRRFWTLCALLGVLALLLRLPTLSSRPLWLDETYSAWFSNLPLHELWTRAPLYETHPPLYYTLLKGWSLLAGRSEAGLRSLSVLASVLTVVAIPACARVARLGARAERIALLAGLFLATNAASIAFAQQARPYALQALAGSLAVFCAAMLVRVLASPAPVHTRTPAYANANASARAWALALALCAGLTLWLHNTGVFAALGIWSGMTLGLLLATKGPRRPQALAVALAGAGALLVWSPFIPMLFEQNAAMAHLSYWVRFSPRDTKAAWTVIAGAPSLHYPAALLVLFGLAWLWRRARAQFWLLLCVLTLPVLALAGYSWLVKPLFLSRLFLWLGPAGMVLAALGVATLPARWRAPVVAAILALSLFAVLGFYRYQTENWRSLLSGLAHDRRPGDLVLAFPNEVQMPVAYYLPRAAVIYLPGPFPAMGLARPYVSNPGAPAIAAEDVARLRTLLPGHRRVWLIERHAELYDPDSLVMRELGRRYRLTRRIAGNGANVWLFESTGAATGTGQP